MKEDIKRPEPGELAGDGLGDATGQATDADSAHRAEGAGPEAKDETVSEQREELAGAQAQIAELNTRVLRAQADFENYRRRVQKEKEDLALYANQKLLVGVLPVLDNLERALATPATVGDEKFRQGVEMTARSFREILSREGVTPIEATGQPFDPHLHEAVMTVVSTEHPAGTVISELQKGYRLGERVIRPSMVQVSSAEEA
jgi:molecular chaperone GrpE